jgi:hypothetical protein
LSKQAGSLILGMSHFSISICTKSNKWLPISINTFLGSGHKFGYRL